MRSEGERLNGRREEAESEANGASMGGGNKGTKDERGKGKRKSTWNLNLRFSSNAWCFWFLVFGFWLLKINLDPGTQEYSQRQFTIYENIKEHERAKF